MIGRTGPPGYEATPPQLSPFASQPATSVKQLILREHDLMGSARDSMDLFRKMRSHLSWEPGLVMGSLALSRAALLNERYHIDMKQIAEFRTRVESIRARLKQAPSAHAVRTHFRPVGGAPGAERYILDVRGSGTGRGVPSFAGARETEHLLDFLHNSEKEQTFDAALEELRMLHDELTLIMAECGFLTVDTVVTSAVESYSEETKAQEASQVANAFERRAQRASETRVEVDVAPGRDADRETEPAESWDA